MEGAVNEMADDVSFQAAIELYRSICRRFEKVEGRSWGAEGATIELMKQVGELAKLVMGMEKYYFPKRQTLEGYAASHEKIGDELADIIAQVIRLADHYQIDLAAAYMKAREDEARSLDEMGV
jgi:NTP pyrophosphatase (non-canonical NTP hydrolase)